MVKLNNQEVRKTKYIRIPWFVIIGVLILEIYTLIRSWKNIKKEDPLKEIKRDNVEYAEAQRLINILKYFREIPAEYVPDNSLLKEFIGGGTFGLH